MRVPVHRTSILVMIVVGRVSGRTNGKDVLENENQNSTDSESWAFHCVLHKGLAAASVAHRE